MAKISFDPLRRRFLGGAASAAAMVTTPGPTAVDAAPATATKELSLARAVLTLISRFKKDDEDVRLFFSSGAQVLPVWDELKQAMSGEMSNSRIIKSEAFNNILSALTNLIAVDLPRSLKIGDLADDAALNQVCETVSEELTGPQKNIKDAAAFFRQALGATDNQTFSQLQAVLAKECAALIDQFVRQPTLLKVGSKQHVSAFSGLRDLMDYCRNPDRKWDTPEGDKLFRLIERDWKRSSKLLEAAREVSKRSKKVLPRPKLDDKKTKPKPEIEYLFTRAFAMDRDNKLAFQVEPRDEVRLTRVVIHRLIQALWMEGKLGDFNLNACQVIEVTDKSAFILTSDAVLAAYLRGPHPTHPIRIPNFVQKCTS